MTASSSQPDLCRSWHRLVWRVLESLNSGLLASAKCYFGGGTRIALELGEFRESVDIHFLCSDRDGYRALRSTIRHNSLGEIFSGSYELMREVRADLYGIRTFLEVDDQPVKFEIISEGRISLAGAATDAFPVEVLDRTSCIAEKLLAHADRGRDESTHSRDLVDLAFMAASWPGEHARDAIVTAESAYGTVIRRELDAGLSRFEDESHRGSCLEALGISDAQTLEQGLVALGRLWTDQARFPFEPGLTTRRTRTPRGGSIRRRAFYNTWSTAASRGTAERRRAETDRGARGCSTPNGTWDSGQTDTSPTMELPLPLQVSGAAGVVT